LTPLLGRTSDRLIAISEAARDDIATTLGLDVGKFDVTPLGIAAPPSSASSHHPDQSRLRERFGLGPEPIVLCVAAKRPHKNLDGLIRALARVREHRPQLVLPGSPTPYEDELRSLAGTLGVERNVRFLGWVSDDDLEALFALASCFALPTFEEGFGLPVLEAMARDVPVVCSDIPTLREVVGNAALLFDPTDPRSIANAIVRVISDEHLARQLVEDGRRRCALFTWRRTAETTLASYRHALGGDR